MNILEQLETRISQLLENMSLMQMEIDELTDKNTYLQNKIAQTEELEAEVIKIRAEQALWHQRLQQLLGKIDDVTVSDEQPQEQTLSANQMHDSIHSADASKIGTQELPQLNEEEMPFFDINQNFTPDETSSDYKKQPLV
ncbi:cell division protein ZapB [Thorsellia kenyensis]|uniref:Cell division protein ZapB n=1 Tax=Thorsellia kenyensis TaxID=1549888 RepID=A0ABV6CCP2_9GAMM